MSNFFDRLDRKIQLAKERAEREKAALQPKTSPTDGLTPTTTQPVVTPTPPATPDPYDIWIPWCGGSCPVDADVLVEVRFRHPRSNAASAGQASYYRWTHISSPSDIVAYKICN